MNQNNSLALILAAGQGTRMKSNTPKPLMEVNGHPMIFWLINDFKKNNIDVTLIINPSDEAIFKEKINNVNFVFQKNPKGTGHAVIQAKNNFKNYKYIYVFVGDCPFVGSKNIAMMYEEHIKTHSDLTILSSFFENKKFPYARIIRDEKDNIIECIEEIDADINQKKIKELFCSHYLFNSDILENYLNKLIPNSKNQEVYLTDIINELIKDKKDINSIVVNDWVRLVGLNTKEDIEWIESQKIN